MECSILLHKRIGALLGALALTVALAGCAQADPKTSDSPSPSASDAMTPSPSPSPSAPEETSSQPGGEDTPDATAPVETGDPSEQPTESSQPVSGLLPSDYDFDNAAPEGPEVEDSWFADAVFIGDSRTDGLRLYSGISSGDFLSYKGLTVFKVAEQACIVTDHGTVTVLEALADKQYAKVYLMLGINELGYPSVDTFYNAYSELIDSVREIQPNAVVYIQTIPAVNQDVGREHDMASYITNSRIVEFNQALSRLAAEKETVLVNVAECLVDENGQLPADLTSDGVHMKRAGYETWYAYLRTHTGTT